MASVRLSKGLSFDIPRCHSGHFLRYVEIRRSSIHWMVVKESGLKPRPLRQVRHDVNLKIKCGLSLVNGMLQFDDIVQRSEIDVFRTRQSYVPIPRFVLLPGKITDFLSTAIVDNQGRKLLRKAARSRRPWDTIRFRFFCK